MIKNRSKFGILTGLAVALVLAMCAIYFFGLNAKSDSVSACLGQENTNSSELFKAPSEPILEREVSPVEMEVVLYLRLMYLRDGIYPNVQDDNYVKLKTTDFKDYTTLDLSDVRDGDVKLRDVSALGLFDLGNLRTLDLSKNPMLTEIESDTFYGMTELDYIDVRNCALTTLDITPLDSIGAIDATNNVLEEINLSGLKPNGSVDLSYNNISSMEDLSLKADGQGATVDLFSNKIRDFNAENYQNYNFIIAYQQEYDELKYDEHTIIKNHKFGEQDFYLECKNIKTKAVTNIVDEGTLAPATYEIFLRTELEYLDYPPATLKIYKSAPTVTITNQKGDEVDISKTLKEGVIIYFDSNDPNYVVEYAVNRNDYIRGNMVELDKNGTYTLTVRAVSADHDSSNVYAFTIKIVKPGSSILKMLSIIFSVLLFIGVVYGLLMYFSRKPKINKKIK